jgi:DNA-directed RNA polymerase subunit M/transcription elongation factor TFIIS
MNWNICPNCGSFDIIIERTANNEVIALLCKSCGHHEIIDTEFFKKLTDVWQQIQEDQQRNIKNYI